MHCGKAGESPIIGVFMSLGIYQCELGQEFTESRDVR